LPEKLKILIAWLNIRDIIGQDMEKTKVYLDTTVPSAYAFFKTWLEKRR